MHPRVDLDYPASSLFEDARILSICHHDGERAIRYVGGSIWSEEDAFELLCRVAGEDEENRRSSFCVRLLSHARLKDHPYRTPTVALV